MITFTPASGNRIIKVKKNTPVYIALTGGKGYVMEVQHLNGDKAHDCYRIGQMRTGEAKRMMKLKEGKNA
ncbi:MAG: hypothetical protein K8953_05210 [Proteobacteria bacterium]|nr:hypothetical protein [Pseudomonadota bacterium]